MAKTQNLPQIHVDVKPRMIYSAYAEAPFDFAKEALESNNYRIISLEENARLRMQEGRNHDVSRYGNWTREGFVYIPSKGIFLTKNSPIMDFPQEATQCHRKGREFYLNNDQIEKSLADAVEIPANIKPIPTKRFGDDNITRYIFGEVAKQYGEFLINSGINEMPIWLANISDKSFARQMWFSGLDDRSDLVGGGGLDCDYWVRGVRETGEAGSPN